MLDSFKTGSLQADIKLAKWSDKRDIVAICYMGSDNIVELRRMDWTRVNQIPLNSKATHFCFSPDGKSLLVSTENHSIYQFDIETTKLISSNKFEFEITAIYFAEYNHIALIGVCLANNTVTIFSDSHFALCSSLLDQNAIELSIYNDSIFVLLEDYVTVQTFKLDFLNSEYNLIKTVSKSLSSFWLHTQIIKNSIKEFDDKWQVLWNEFKDFSENSTKFAKAFLIGKEFERPLSETRLTHVKKQVEQIINQLRDIIASNIIPSLLRSDESCEQVEIASKIFPKDLGITIHYTRSKEQLQECLSILETLSKLEDCFNATFECFTSNNSIFDILEKYNISSANYLEFLAKHFKYFQIHNLTITNKTESVPKFESTQKETYYLEGNFSTLNKSYVTYINANSTTVINLIDGENRKFDSEFNIDVAFPFEDGCVGVFTKNEEKSFFTMFGRDEEEEDSQPSVQSVPTDNIAAYDISNRRLALLQSTDKLFSVVDLESVAEAEEDDE